MNWYQFPQKIKNWNANIDYVMFVDENGNGGRINNILKKLNNNIQISDDERYFTVTGCIFKKSNYSIIRNNIRKLKEKYWPNGFYNDTKHNESRYVCLHSREIRRHDGPFNDNLINYSNFINDLSKILAKVNCKIISISINLEENIKSGNFENVYEKAFDLLLEKYIYTIKERKKGIIMLESRGKNEDKILLNHIYDIIHNKGKEKITTKELEEKIMGVYFNPKWYKGHSSTFVGLEIADLFSYPIHQYVKYKKENLSFKTIKEKIVGYPNFNNNGIKIYPKEKDG